MSHRITKENMDAFIRDHRFEALFVELGWDREGLPSTPLPIPLNEHEFLIRRVAHKRGFVVCVCDAGKNYPAHKSDRRRLVNKLMRHHYEHLLIIHGENKQRWTVAIRPQNLPLRTVEVEWHKSHDIQPLMEKLGDLIFDISEEGTLGITDVVDRVRFAFMQGAEQVTKRFYREFKENLSEFSNFIQGIRDRVSQDWYAALMLNRLMFIYFIQKKRFLAGDPHYLKNRLADSRENFGADQFHDRFYRHFLRRLFAEGLGTPQAERDPALNKLLGKVPYLNGGLFDLHEIERENQNIDIPDRAFEKLFAFFDEYNWRLDSRPAATGRDINPDVIGYIFEKYINDRAAMGAYYTSEDVTGYIARNTIIPFLLNRARERCKNAFDPESGIWRFLRESPGDYIYDAVKKGCDIPNDEIPEPIRRGLNTTKPNLLERRGDWNTSTDARFALPTEIWRETIARRNRCFELKDKIKNGEIREIDDLITHNLDIERFAADALRHYEGADFIDAFYAAIAGKKALQSNRHSTRGITVLDPACGSGAFLFAALNILEPLYEKCVERMREFVDEDDRLRAQGRRHGTKKHPQFRAVLAEINRHPNEKYWIYKTIILNNLYGVDLMKEAAEIAKLRLFLKLAAEAVYDPNKENLGLEPLPDIDFNIRSGNSLVGFASMAQVEKSITPDKGQVKIDFGKAMKTIREAAATVDIANRRFKESQNAGGEAYRKDKLDLQQRLNALNKELNQYLAATFGKKDNGYQAWLDSHRPFHWVTEFYGIIEQDGGFDVVIGNPPYVEYSKVKKTYTVRDYETETCGNLYAFFMERALAISGKHSNAGYIVPVSMISTQGYFSLRELYVFQGKLHISSYNIHPSRLFDSAYPRLSIVLLKRSSNNMLLTSRYQKWYQKERDNLLNLLHYHEIPKIWYKKTDIPLPKIESMLSLNIFTKLKSENSRIENYVLARPTHESKPIFYRRAFGAFVLFYDEIPEMYDEKGEKVIPTELKCLNFHPKHHDFMLGVYHSNIFYVFTNTFSDCRNINKPEVYDFNIDLNALRDFHKELAELTHALSAELQSNSRMMDYNYKTGRRVFQAFFPRDSKKIIDKIDRVLAKHYGFTEEELDHIINYDIKYRMGLPAK